MGLLRRHPWRTGAAGLAVAAGTAVALVWFQPQALLITHTVDEPAPAAAAPRVTASLPASVATQIPLDRATPSAPAVPQVLSRTTFRSLEHATSGTALLLRLADGSTVLRLENLDTSNGPDVHVTLSTTPSTAADRDYGGLLELGDLKGNRGSQNYTVPAGTV